MQGERRCYDNVSLSGYISDIFIFFIFTRIIHQDKQRPAETAS